MIRVIGHLLAYVITGGVAPPAGADRVTAIGDSRVTATGDQRVIA